MRTLEEVHAYWRSPDGKNHPQDYLAEDRKYRSLFVVAVVKELVDTKARILEIGSNAGRNLFYLHTSGYTNLEAVEINEEAVLLMKQTYPLIYPHMHVGAIEDCIGDLTGEFDLTFTLAVLEHIHPDSERVFPRIARRSAYLLTIEDEAPGIWRQFERNYGDVFTQIGMRQVWKLGDLRFIGLKDGFVARLFRWH